MQENLKKRSYKYRRLVGDTIIFAIGNLGSKIILFFMVPLYTNFLSTEEYGTSDLVFTVAQLIVPFTSLVIFDAVLRFGLSKNEKKEDVLKTSIVVIAIGSVATIIITPLFSFYESLAEWRWYLCAYVILTMISNVLLNYLKVIDKNKTYAMISISHTMVLAISNVVFLVNLHFGVRGYLMATILGILSSTILSIIFGKLMSHIRNGSVNKKLMKEMVVFSSPLILNNVSWWIIQSSDKIMIEAMIGTAALGLYTTSTKIPSLINVIISIFSQAWGISSVREFESSNDSKFYSNIFISYSVIGFGLALCISAIIKPFMSVYVAEDFFECWKFIPLLLASASFSAVASYYGSLYGALKKSTNNMKSTVIAATLNIVINYIFIHWIGIWGAVIGTVVAYFVLAFYRMVDVLKYVEFNPKWKELLINVTIVLIQAILISLDFYILIVSIISIAVFMIVNRNTINKIVVASMSIIRRIW